MSFIENNIFFSVAVNNNKFYDNIIVMKNIIKNINSYKYDSIKKLEHSVNTSGSDPAIGRKQEKTN